MNRRTFLKGSSLVCAGALFPDWLNAAPQYASQALFDPSIYEANGAQTIMVFLYGGPSELSGNLANIDQIDALSQNSYRNYFYNLTNTANDCWQEAGGDIMESMISAGDMNLFRTCFSARREAEDNRAHGLCVSQNQRGMNNRLDTAGIFSNIAHVLYENGVIDGNTRLPFMSMEGESTFFAQGDLALPASMRPTAVSSQLENPFARRYDWYMFNEAERTAADSDSSVWESQPQLDRDMDAVAQAHNPGGKIRENFGKRAELDAFIDELNEAPLPDGITYPQYNDFAASMASAIKVLVNNPDTKVISVGTPTLGGWDDHDSAQNYVARMQELMQILEIAVNHIKAENKEGEINIMLFGEFGRNVNLNSASGWDHGNNQNVFTLLGKNYFNDLGIVGQTQVYDYGELNRLYLHPQTGSYAFEPFSIAATLYRMYGITNPEVLTGGHAAIGAGLLRR